MMLFKKYTPSVKNNNQLRDKVVYEVQAVLYQMERGRFSSEADKESILRIVDDLKLTVEALSNTVGTGEENIEALSTKILSLIKDFKKASEQDMLHRIQEIADELDFSMNLWKDVLDGVAFIPSEEDAEKAKLSYTRKKLNSRLAELSGIKDAFVSNAKRIENDIVALEKDQQELDALMLKEDNERRINEIFKRINANKAKQDALTVRKSNYTTCFNLLDMIYVNAAEIVEASDYAVDEIGKAKVLLNMSKLKRVLSEPDRALGILKHMQAEIQEIYNRTKTIDAKLGDMSTTSTVVSDDALAYKEELMRKKREKEKLAQNASAIELNETESINTITEEDK